VLRGWQPAELLGLADAAGLGARARVHELFPYRLVLIVERGIPTSRPAAAVAGDGSATAERATPRTAPNSRSPTGGPPRPPPAILLAGAGARVRVLDKAVFPREKLCGEFVSPEALPILAHTGVLSSLAAGASRMSEAVFTSSSGGVLRLPVPDGAP